MRSQIRGLDKASSNAQDGISLIQTAEGALNEAHSILQRMNELAVQGANDTNENIDRDAINEELDALTTELDRISTTTQFNKQNLLDGSFQNKNLQVGANADQKIKVSIGNMNAQTLGLRSVQKNYAPNAQTGTTVKSINYRGTSYAYVASKTMDANVSAAKSTFAAAISGKYTSANYVQTYDSDTKSAYYVGMEDGKRYSSVSAAKAADIANAKSAMKKSVDDNLNDYIATSASKATALSAYTEVGRVSVDNYDVANKSITAIQEAINKVSSQRSSLGAIQNRLEHTVANLDNVSENTQSAESRIRDTDMASEMVNYSKNNILAQAGQSMLTQANQSTQGVLSLLQ